MGFYGIHARAYCRLTRLGIGAPRSRWLTASWRVLMTFLRQSNPPLSPSLQPARTFLFQPCAINPHSPGRATKSIQRNLLRRRHSRLASGLRRWMLPTVERGPPIG
jgi:hypothetical protein